MKEKASVRASLCVNDWSRRRSFSSGRNCVNDCKLFGRNIHGYAFWNPTTEQCLIERALVDDPLPLSNETHSHGDVSRFHCTDRYALEDRYIAVHNRWRRQNEIPIWRKHRVPQCATFHTQTGGRTAKRRRRKPEDSVDRVSEVVC